MLFVRMDGCMDLVIDDLFGDGDDDFGAGGDVVMPLLPLPESDVVYSQQYAHLAFQAMQGGATAIEVAAAIRVDKDTFEGWQNHKDPRYQPDFARAIRLGQVQCEAYWVAQGRAGMTAKSFNFSAWQRVMTEIFKWSDSSTKDKAALDGMAADAIAARLELENVMREMDADGRAEFVQLLKSRRKDIEK